MGNKLYEEKSVQAIADALRLKQDGSMNTYTISQMEGGVLNLPMGNIPTYHYEEAGRVAKRLLELKSLYPNSIVFGTVSDNHADKTTTGTLTSVRHAVYALETIGSLTCDFIANLGDNVVGTNIDNDTDFANATYMENASRYALTSLLSFNLIGNHEKSNSTQKLFDLIGKYNTFDDYGATQIRGFGYKDLPEKKVRITVLNTTDYWNSQGGNGMSYEQKDFFMKALDLSSKQNSEEWLNIVLTHIPLDFLGGDYNKGADLKAILKAYDEGTSVSIAVNNSYAQAQNEADKYSGTLTYNYAGKNSAKVVNIHGHIHTNKYGKLKFIDDNTELNIVRIATPNSSFNGNASTDRYADYGDYSITAEEAEKIKKISGTKADTSATFYFIDLNGQIIHAIGYGADIDRTVAYKDANYYTISYSLAGCTSSNTSTQISEGDTYATTIMLEDSVEMQSVVITMGGKDITSTAYSNGNISINNVTGNISITVVAEVVPLYTNLFDASAVQSSTRFSSGGDITSGNFWCMETYLACNEGDVFRVQIPSGNWADHNQRVVVAYDTGKTHVSKDLYVSSCTVSNDGRLLTAVIPSGVNYIRISGLPANQYEGTIITKNEEIN